MSDLDAIREDVALAARSVEMARHVALDHAPELLDEVERLRAERDRALAAVARVEARVARLREDYASELAATDPDTNWALGVKHAVQLVARELRREAS